MLSELANHNEDIRRLIGRGYSLKLDSSYLVVRDIPYLDHERKLRIGAFVEKVEFINQVTIKPPQDHQIFFTGTPHGVDGQPIPNLGGGTTSLVLTDPAIVVERRFSNKPREGFASRFDKIESYVSIIAGPAMALHGATPYTGRLDESEVTGSVFKTHDTLTSRAEIGDLAQKLKDEVVVIIGLGGTGAYLLDLMVKTPVKEIRGFDHDAFCVHNAFRSPGRLEMKELGIGKAGLYAARYDNFRYGLVIEPRFIDASSEEQVAGATFAFVCVDKGSSRAGIFDLLLAKKIPFIDVGMGLHRNSGPLSGLIRLTYYPSDIGQSIRARDLAEMVDDPDDIYRTHVQLAELNALNASLAVIKYKQLKGFYNADSPWDHLLLGVDDLHVVGEAWQSSG